MGRRKVLIYGVGQTGNMVASILELDEAVEIVGFVDDDEDQWGERLRGYEVLGGRAFVTAGRGFDAVAVAIGQVDPRRSVAERLHEAVLEFLRTHDAQPQHIRFYETGDPGDMTGYMAQRPGYEGFRPYFENIHNSAVLPED